MMLDWLMAIWFWFGRVAGRLRNYLMGPNERVSERLVRFGPFGLLWVTIVAVAVLIFRAWLLANEVRIGALQIGNRWMRRKRWIQKPLRWLLMPIVLPIDLIGTVIYWATLSVSLKLDEISRAHKERRLQSVRLS